MIFTHLRKQSRIRAPASGCWAWHTSKGREYHEIATALRVGKGTVQDWAKRFKAAGLRLQEQRSGGRVTGLDIQEMLKNQFQVACCLNSVYNLLSRLGRLGT